MVSIPTPTFSHLKDEDYDYIYEPAEDSFLLMDALEKDYEIIKKKRPLICLEVGPGSGVVITFLASMLKNSGYFVASDINDYASHATRKTSDENNVDINTVTDNMLSSLAHRLSNKVDVLLFNPPYVVTPSEEVGGTSLTASWAGGINGREVIDKFLPIACQVLSENGLFYLLLLKQNKPGEIMTLMEKFGLIGTVVCERKAGCEYLYVVRFTKSAIT